jgi:hypothetical protein
MAKRIQKAWRLYYMRKNLVKTASKKAQNSFSVFS